MFFRKISDKRAARQKEVLDAAKEKIESCRAEIKNRLAQVDSVSLTLCEVAKLTQAVTIDTAEKFDRMMKIPKKSLREISSKLHEGLVLINSSGEIVHINRQGAKILGIDGCEIVGKKLGEVITCCNAAVAPDGTPIEKPILREEFFPGLSSKIFGKLGTPELEANGKYVVCNDILREELPFCFDKEQDRVMGVSIACGDKKIMNMTVTFTVIDNDPDEVADITYLFLFSTSA